MAGGCLLLKSMWLGVSHFYLHVDGFMALPVKGVGDREAGQGVGSDSRQLG